MIYPDKLVVNDRMFKVSYLKASKLTSSVKIKKSTIIIRLSRFAFGKQRDEMVKKFLNWAKKKLSKIAQNEFILPDYKDGGFVYTHNKVYEISVKLGDYTNFRVKIDENSVIRIFLSNALNNLQKQEVIKVLVEKMIIKDQTSYLEEVIDELNQLYFQKNYNLCRFKRTVSRFGSCSAKGNINIAYRLLFAPREVFRYVCIHELAHLEEMNHSSKFWNLVMVAMPDYKKYEKWLRENGFMLG